VVYAAIIVAVLFAALGRDERTDAPPPPPKGAEPLGEALGPASPFDPSVVVDVPDQIGPAAGTAFSIARSGVWMTARHVVDGCKRVAIVVGPGTGVAVKVYIDPHAEAAMLFTEGGSAPLPLGLSQPLRRGQRAFHPGFPQGEPGEASSRLLGRENLVVRGHGARTEPVLVWAETGRTEGLTGGLPALTGAPVIDETGRVAGLVLTSSHRRGTFSSTGRQAVSRAIAKAGVTPSQGAEQTVDTTNYARVADELRRDLSVVEVKCLE